MAASASAAGWSAASWSSSSAAAAVVVDDVLVFGLDCCLASSSRGGAGVFYVWSTFGPHRCAGGLVVLGLVVVVVDVVLGGRVRRGGRGPRSSRLLCPGACFGWPARCSAGLGYVFPAAG